MTSSTPTRPSWGLVLSGGAAWGIANAGVIEVLERENLKPDYIAGSSMGAIIAGIIACGHGSDVLKDLCSKLSLAKVARISENPLKGGLHGGLLRQNLHDFLASLLGKRTIGECDIPFVCIAGKILAPIAWQKIIREGFTEQVMKCVEKHVFPPETRVLDAIMASSAIPVLFSPVKIGDDEFVDLCNFGAIPSRTLREIYHPDIVIATDTSPRHSYVRNVLPASWRAFLDASNEFLQESRAACDLVITPTFRHGPARFDKADHIYLVGKEAAEKALPDIRRLVGP